jgi:hypothetical protein
VAVPALREHQQDGQGEGHAAGHERRRGDVDEETLHVGSVDGRKAGKATIRKGRATFIGKEKAGMMEGKQRLSMREALE